MTHQWTEDPCFVVAVDNHWWTHAEHDHEVRNSQIDNQKVRRGTECLSLSKDVDDTQVSNHSDGRKDKNGKAKDRMPKWIPVNLKIWKRF